MRGRVIAIRLAVALGGTPIGAPIVGWVADRFGPRWALDVGAASGIAAAMVGLRYLIKYRGLRVRVDGGAVRLVMAPVARPLSSPGKAELCGVGEGGADEVRVG
jgi:MFS family permease